MAQINLTPIQKTELEKGSVAKLSLRQMCLVIVYISCRRIMSN